MGKKGAARTKKKPRSTVPVVHKHIAGVKYEDITVN